LAEDALEIMDLFNDPWLSPPAEVWDPTIKKAKRKRWGPARIKVSDGVIEANRQGVLSLMVALRRFVQDNPPDWVDVGNIRIIHGTHTENLG